MLDANSGRVLGYIDAAGVAEVAVANGRQPFMSCRPFLRILRWFDLRFMLGDVIGRQLQHLFRDDEVGESKVRGEFPFSSVTIRNTAATRFALAGADRRR